MRLALFTPLPPVKSGIADYSAALLEHLRAFAEVTVFEHEPKHFDPDAFDALIYQIGNNQHHEFAYRMALRHPGIVVLHEANLHHLVAEITIRQGDWDAYLREVEYDGGAAALEYGRRVQALEVGPDYEGVPMLRRVLERSKGAIVHSEAVGSELRRAGFAGPIGRIPHGAWIEEVNRWEWRARLGVEEATPLVGIFGFLKPYKRIAESLRAFRRLVRVVPEAKMILVGEPHPDLPVASLIRSLDLTASVRLLGYTPIEHFSGYISACDVVLNLRYPTVGESSGTLLRALGLGRAVIVSDVGSFREYPDEVCLKLPVDAAEEELLFEYLNLLTSRPEAALELGRNAREWVRKECSWDLAARRYVEFAKAVAQGAPWPPAEEQARAAAAAASDERVSEPEAQSEPRVEAGYIVGWAKDDDARDYVRTHSTRLVKTLEITPPGGPEMRVLEMGAYLQITPALKTRLGYGEVRGCYYGPVGKVDRRVARSPEGEEFACEIEHFDAERDAFPYADEYFDTVLCCELVEHLREDPMHMMQEVNRILKPGGHLVLTTPNICSLRAIAAILEGYHPGFFPAYIRPAKEGEEPDARHNREYAPREVAMLLEDSGFEVTRLETAPFRAEPQPTLRWVAMLLERYSLAADLREDGIYAVGRKIGPIRARYPDWLYS